MAAYLVRRILLMIPTLLGIMFVSFVVVQFAPGGPVERVIAQISGSDTGATSRISASQGGDFSGRAHGPRFDVWASSGIIVGYAIPGFLFAILLIILFLGGPCWGIPPWRGPTPET